MVAGGLEVLGAIVTIIEAIELGAKVALKLSTFCREATAANESMKGLSIDVTLTCAILSDLSKVLKKDKHMKFAPESASETAAKVIEECKLVFEDILVFVEKQERETKQGLWQRATHMLTIAFHGHDLEKLKVNLERLKSTVILMLNVMIFASQVRQNTPALAKIIEGLSRLLAKRKEDRETGIKKLQTMIDLDKANNASGKQTPQDRLSPRRPSFENRSKSPFSRISELRRSCESLTSQRSGSPT